MHSTLGVVLRTRNLLKYLIDSAKHYPVVLLDGQRQLGKATERNRTREAAFTCLPGVPCRGVAGQAVEVTAAGSP